jgi:salicylate hydroxylase
LLEANKLRTKDQGQGGCQAIEDGISIGMFLSNCSPESIPKRIEAWENLRIKRASAIQILSNAGQDEPERIQEEAAQFIPAESVPSTSSLNDSTVSSVAIPLKRS